VRRCLIVAVPTYYLHTCSRLPKTQALLSHKKRTTGSPGSRRSAACCGGKGRLSFGLWPPVTRGRPPYKGQLGRQQPCSPRALACRPFAAISRRLTNFPLTLPLDLRLELGPRVPSHCTTQPPVTLLTAASPDHHITLSPPHWLRSPPATTAPSSAGLQTACNRQARERSTLFCHVIYIFV